MSFEKHGLYEADREAIEQFILGSFRESLQDEVDQGKMTQGDAIKIHVEFQRSEAFRQAVEATIKNVMANMTERNASGRQPH